MNTTQSLTNIVSAYLKQATDPGVAINRNMYGLDIDVENGTLEYRLGNWTDAGWHWDGSSDEGMFGLYLYRLATAGQNLGNSFLKDFANLSPEAQKVANTVLRETVMEESGLEQIAYALSGDNACHHFGQCSWDITDDSDRVANIIADSYDLAEHLGVEQRELSDFLAEYYWDSGGQNYADEAYKKSVPDLIDMIKQNLVPEAGNVAMFLKSAGKFAEDAPYEVYEILENNQYQVIGENYEVKPAELGEKLADEFGYEDEEKEKLIAAVEDYFKYGNRKHNPDQYQLPFEANVNSSIGASMPTGK